MDKKQSQETILEALQEALKDNNKAGPLKMQAVIEDQPFYRVLDARVEVRPLGLLVFTGWLLATSFTGTLLALWLLGGLLNG